MPRPKLTVKKSFIRWRQEAWNKLQGKGEISPLINKLVVEKLDEPTIAVVINTCRHYFGVSEKNPTLIWCNDNPQQKPYTKPKSECQACQYSREHLIIFDSIEKLEKRKEKLEGAVLGLHKKEEALTIEINELTEKAKGIDVEDLKEKLTAAQRVVETQYKQKKELEEKVQNLEDKLALTKVEPKDVIKEVPREIIKEIPKFREVTITVYRSVEINCPLKGWINIIDCKQKCEQFLECKYFNMFRIVEHTEKSTSEST